MTAGKVQRPASANAWLCMCVFVSLALAAPAVAQAKRVGFLPLDPVRLPGDVLFLLQADLQLRLEARGDMGVLSQREMLTHLQAVRDFGLSCDRASKECITRIGALAGTSLIVRGLATRGEVLETGYEVTLQLWLHDGSDGRVLSYVYASLPSTSAAREIALDDVWARLFTPAESGGTLHVVSEVEGAEIYVDTMRVKEHSGEARLRGLAAGDHLVEVNKPGHEPLTSQATVAVGEEVEVYALLAPVENDPVVPVIVPKPRMRLDGVGYSMAATGTLLFVVSSGALIYGVSENLQRNAIKTELQLYDRLYRSGDYDITNANDAARVARLQSQVSDNLVPIGATVGGGVLALLGAVMVSGALTLFALGEE